MAIIQSNNGSASLPEIRARLGDPIAERTLRRWLGKWIADGSLTRSGNRRSTRYHLPSPKPVTLAFLEGLSASKKTAVLNQLRDLWTHTSTAVEGNTLTLGDTHFVLEQGLTISGKPLKDHQEVIGHAQAIALIYKSLHSPLTEQMIFDLHRAVQTERISDIYKPYGTWKNEANGTYVVNKNNQQIYIEYALPKYVPALMSEFIYLINRVDHSKLTIENAANTYAKFHAAFVHIHPFWDGNGRLARLIANIPLLKAGLPPIVIPQEKRQDYIQLLAEYEVASGQLDDHTGIWPSPERLMEFKQFCSGCYYLTKEIVESY
ncbi:Fic family protein [Porticoccus sp. GXU_MW_L64]